MSGIILMTFNAQSLPSFNHLWIDASAPSGAVFLKESHLISSFGIGIVK
jgi:hypothetical protein